MSTKALQPSVSNLYDEDFAAWTSHTAHLLRAGRLADLDVEHLAEEVEDMGKSERREVLSRITVLLLHLLKWKFQPRKRTGSWQSTLASQRAELSRVFEDSPSLRNVFSKSLPAVYSDAVEQAAAETGLPAEAFPDGCPFSPDQIMDRGFLPD